MLAQIRVSWVLKALTKDGDNYKLTYDTPKGDVTITAKRSVQELAENCTSLMRCSYRVISRGNDPQQMDCRSGAPGFFEGGSAAMPRRCFDTRQCIGSSHRFPKKAVLWNDRRSAFSAQRTGGLQCREPCILTVLCPGGCFNVSQRGDDRTCVRGGGRVRGRGAQGSPRKATLAPPVQPASRATLSEARPAGVDVPRRAHALRTFVTLKWLAAGYG